MFEMRRAARHSLAPSAQLRIHTMSNLWAIMSYHHQAEAVDGRAERSAIDGGGVKGVVALALLKKLTAALGSPVGDYFDYAAGTSAGML